MDAMVAVLLVILSFLFLGLIIISYVITGSYLLGVGAGITVTSVFFLYLLYK